MKRVLIAEDHQDTSNAIRDFMKFIFPEFSLEYCATGKDAIAETIKNPADVLVLDIALGDNINGLEVIKKLWEGGLRDKPRVIVITALGNRAFRGPYPGRPWVDQLNEHERTLVAAFFEKPYGWHAFLKAVAQAAGVPPPDKIKLIPENE